MRIRGARQVPRDSGADGRVKKACTRFRPIVQAISLAAALAVAGCGSASTSVVEPTATKCEVSATNNTPEIAAAGGTGTVAIATSRDCAWSAAAEAAWINLAVTNGQGPANLNYTVLANPAGTPRRGRLVVAQQSVDVAQAAAPCRYDASPATVAVDALEHQVSIAVTAPDGCHWKARSDAAWIGGLTPPEGVGSATVRVTIATNTTQSRAGTFSVENAAVRISQSGPADAPAPPAPGPPPAPPPTPPPPQPPTCNYRLAQSSRRVTRDPQEFSVGISAPPGCTWTVSTAAGWITIPGGQNGSGDGSFRIAVAGNTGDPRAGSVRVATETFTVQQAGACSYTIKPTSYDAGRGPDDIEIDVEAGIGCAWTTATGAEWVTIDAGRTGSGSGRVRLLIPFNNGPARTALVTIAGNGFTLRQEGSCVFSIKPTYYHSGHGPDDIRIAVAGDPGCTWTAASSVPWVSVAEGASGTGNGTVRLRVQPNSGPARSVTLTIAGQPFDLRQDGPRQ